MHSKKSIPKQKISTKYIWSDDDQEQEKKQPIKKASTQKTSIQKTSIQKVQQIEQVPVLVPQQQDLQYVPGIIDDLTQVCNIPNTLQPYAYKRWNKYIHEEITKMQLKPSLVLENTRFKSLLYDQVENLNKKIDGPSSYYIYSQKGGNILNLINEILAYPYYPSNEASFERTSLARLRVFLNNRDKLQIDKKCTISEKLLKENLGRFKQQCNYYMIERDSPESTIFSVVDQLLKQALKLFELNAFRAPTRKFYLTQEYTCIPDMIHLINQDLFIITEVKRGDYMKLDLARALCQNYKQLRYFALESENQRGDKPVYGVVTNLYYWYFTKFKIKKEKANFYYPTKRSFKYSKVFELKVDEPRENNFKQLMGLIRNHFSR